MCSVPLLSWEHEQEAGSELEQLGLALALIREAGIAVSGFIAILQLNVELSIQEWGTFFATTGLLDIYIIIAGYTT